LSFFRIRLLATLLTLARSLLYQKHGDRLKSRHALGSKLYNKHNDGSVSIMRSYNHEFKQYAVKLIVDENKPMAEVARELDVPYGTLNKWAIKFRKHSCN